MSAIVDDETRLRKLAEDRYVEIIGELEEGMIARALPAASALDLVILELQGVRAIVTGNIMPTSAVEQRGLRRLLDQRWADVRELLEFDRRDAAAGRNSCTDPIETRIAAYEDELRWLEAQRTLLRSYEALRRVADSLAHRDALGALLADTFAGMSAEATEQRATFRRAWATAHGEGGVYTMEAVDGETQSALFRGGILTVDAVRAAIRGGEILSVKGIGPRRLAALLAVVREDAR